MSGTLTDEHYDWITEFCGVDPRSYAGPEADSQLPASDDSCPVATPHVTDQVGATATSVAGPAQDTGASQASQSDGTGVVTIPEVTVYGDPNASNADDEHSADPDREDDNADQHAMAMAGGPRGGRPPADDLDEGEGLNRDGTVRRKAGDHGRARGGESKGAQDGVVDEAVKDFDLTPDERKRLHDEIGGRNLGRKTIRQIAEEIAKGRKPAKDTESPENPEESTAEDQATPATSEHSTLEKVAAVVALLGLSALLIPTIAAAVLDPEPATKLGLIGLSAAEIAAISAAFGFAFSSPSSSGDPPQA